MDVNPQDVLNARKAAGLTQAQAAELVNSARRTWQDWETGRAAVDVARYRLFLHLAGLERLPFGTERREESLPEHMPATEALKRDDYRVNWNSWPTDWQLSPFTSPPADGEG